MSLRMGPVIVATTCATEATAPATAPRGSWRSARRPDIDTDRCTGCGRCVAACDLHLLSLEVVRWEKFSVLHEPGRCTGCGACAVICPFGAITLRVQAVAAAVNGVAAPATRPE